MVKIVGVVIGVLVFPGIGTGQVAVTDTALIAEVLAMDLKNTKGQILIEDAGIGVHVANALDVPVVPKRPRPVCPWVERITPERGVVLVVRLMELDAVRARVYVDTMCSAHPERPGDFNSLVSYELEKRSGEWRVVGRRTLHIT